MYRLHCVEGLGQRQVRLTGRNPQLGSMQHCTVESTSRMRPKGRRSLLTGASAHSLTGAVDSTHTAP